MVRKGFKPEQIIGKLREAEVLLSQGSTVCEASRNLGVTEQTYYRWRKAQGGMRVEQAKRLQALEEEPPRMPSRQQGVQIGQHIAPSNVRRRRHHTISC